MRTRASADIQDMDIMADTAVKRARYRLALAGNSGQNKANLLILDHTSRVRYPAMSPFKVPAMRMMNSRRGFLGKTPKTKTVT